MAFTKEVSDVNLGSVSSPVGPVQERVADASGVARSIASLGKTVAQGAVAVQKINDQQIINDYTAQTKQRNEEFLNQQSELSDADKSKVAEFNNKIDKLEAAKSQQSSTDKYRALQEAELKKAITANPHLAPELRQAAAGALGFQPIGEQLRQMEASSKAAQTFALGQLKDLDEMSQKMGYLPGEIFEDADKQSEFLLRVENNRVTQRLTELKQAQEAGLVNGKVYQSEFMGKLPSVAQAGRDQLFSNFANDIQTIAANNGIQMPEIKSPLQMTPEALQSFVSNPAAMQQLEQQLMTYENSIRAQTAAATSSFDDNALRTTVETTMLAPLKQLQTLISSDGNIKYFQDQVKQTQTLAQSNLYQSVPELAKFEAVTKALGNVALLPQVQADLYVKWKPAIDALVGTTKLDANGNVIVNPKAPEPDTEVFAGADPKQIEPMVEHFGQLITNQTENKEVLGAMLNTYGKIFSSPELGKNKPAMDAVFKMMNNPENKATLMEWMEENPELGSNIQKMYSTYSKNAVAQTGKEISNMMSEYSDIFGAKSSSFESGSPIKINYANGKFILTLDEEGLQRYRNSNSSRNIDARVEAFRNGAMQKISKWQSTYLQPMNKHISSFSDISGAEGIDQAAASLVAGTPLATIFAKETGIQTGEAVVTFVRNPQTGKLERKVDYQ